MCATIVISTSHVVFGVCAIAVIITSHVVWCLCNCSHYYKAAAVTVQPVCLCKFRHPTLCLQLQSWLHCNCRHDYIPCFVYMQEQSLLLHLILILCNCRYCCVLCCLCEYGHRCILCCIFAQSAGIAFCATIAFCVISTATVSRTCIVTLMLLQLWSSWLQFLWQSCCRSGLHIALSVLSIQQQW